MFKTHRSKRALGLLGVLLACGLATTGAQAQADHLMMTKVVVKTRLSPQIGSEYVAIHNPLPGDIDLSGYYLSDATLTGARYWELVLAGGQGGGGTGGDFNARFPDGATLGGGATITVSLEGSIHFLEVYGELPDFELFEDGLAPDDVPELVEARPGGIAYGLGNPVGNAPPSTGWLDDAETLVLYHWDGVSDLVDDVDYLTWGTATTSRVDKSGVAMDGPDADTATSAYLSDTSVSGQDPMALHDFTEANARLDLNEGTETLTGGNGLGGHDETSENLSATWNIIASMDPPAGGTATFATPIITAAATTATPIYENAAATLEITLLSPPSNGPDEMIVRWRADGGAWQGVGGYDQGGGAWGAVIPGQTRDTVVDWWIALAGEEGGSETWPNAAPLYYESYTVQPPVDPGDGPAHLLLTEVCVLGTSNEFIEIYNPTDEAVDLSNYYITDACYNDQGYWRLPEGNPTQATVGGGDFTDFHARFPDGAMIQPGAVLTLAIAGSAAFNGAWGMMPDLDLLTDMREIFAGSIDGSAAPTLSNSGEIVVLYYWDGVSNLVSDVDMFFWGSSTSARVDKTGYSIGGSTYADDTPLASQDIFSSEHGNGEAFQRLDDGETGEPTSGSNGPGGHDETGEPFNTTWGAATGTPGVHGGSVLNITGVIRSPNAPEPEDTVAVTATIVATETLTTVDLAYRSGGAGSYSMLPMTDNLDGTWTATIPAFADGTLVEYYVGAADDQSGTALYPADAPTTVLSYTVEVFVPGTGPARLLLTEIATLGSSAEFIEIHNPNDFDVDLGHYYLTDAVHYTDQAYWNLPAGNPSQTTVGGGAFSDFHARFPGDAVLPAGGSITMTMAGSDLFDENFPGLVPDYELFEDGSSADNVVDMEEVFPGSTGGGATLTNLSDNGTYINGEVVVLYYWDGVSELVTDVDIFIWGEGLSYSASKASITIGSSTYAAEAGYPEPFMSEHAHLQSYQRVDLNEGTEVQSGANGIDGADETSENFTTTWTVGAASPSFQGDSELAVLGATLTPSRPQPDEDATVTVTMGGAVDVTSVTLSYAVDGGDYQHVACTDNGEDTWSAVIPGQAQNAVVTWYVSAEGAGSETVVWPEGAPGSAQEYTVEVFVPGEGLARLLLTEIATLGSTAEFIEIHNPNDFEVPLRNYYLTDAVYYEDQAYWNLPAGNPSQSTIGGGDFSDFHARFPDDAVLPAGGYISVSMPGSGDFGSVFLDPLIVKTPHYEMFEDGDTQDAVPDMADVFPGSINGAQTPTLTNLGDNGTYINGEIVVLYYWDGVSDLVTDIDIFIWGEGNSYSASKGGITIGSSTYANEAGYPDPFMTEHMHLQSYTRVDYTEGDEVQSGGNGFEGADETSENLSETWEVMDADPAFYVQPEGTGGITLKVPAKTFLPLSNEELPIEFTSEGNSETVLRIFDLEGRLVRTLFDSRFDGNPSTDIDWPSSEPWDGRNDVFELVKAGLYIVHMQVTNRRTGDRVEKTAPAVVATRLSN